MWIRKQTLNILGKTGESQIIKSNWSLEKNQGKNTYDEGKEEAKNGLWNRNTNPEMQFNQKTESLVKWIAKRDNGDWKLNDSVVILKNTHTQKEEQQIKKCNG